MREAEHWFWRSHRVAVWLDDFEAQVRCLNSLGVLSYLTGNYSRAERRLARGLALATKRGLRVARGEILHDLFDLELTRQDFARAEEYASGALRYYLPRHDRLPALGHDVACLWMEQGHFARALPLLRAVVRHLSEWGQLFQTYAAAARAAGGAGDDEAFEWASKKAWEAAGCFDESRTRAAALVDLARGAASLGRWTEAIETFEQARSVAQLRGEADVLVRAEVGLEAARAGRSADTPARPQRRSSVSHAESVAREMINALQPLQPVAA
jgi:tetratricopeptide (TPR) repeat protein